MNVIKKKMLDGYAVNHTEAKEALASWRKIFEKTEFSDIHAIRSVLPTADYADPHTIFNIKGNHYRLITIIHYRPQRVYIKNFLPMLSTTSGTTIAKGVTENEHHY